MNRSVGLRRRIALIVAAGVLVVALGVTLLLINTISLHESSVATTRSDAYLVSAINVERLVVDAETGLRGYVITGRALFLQPTRRAQAQMPQAARALSDEARRNAAFVPEAKALYRSANTYMTGYLPSIVRLAQRDRHAAQSFAVTYAGKQLVDTVRSNAARLDGLVSARDGARQRSAQREASRATTEAIVVLVLLTVLTVALGTFLGRLVISRERARRQSEETTRVLRQSLLPEELPSIPDCEVAVRFIPARAAELVGGDFYDVFAVGDGRWAIAVGDVCGKGADAAAVTAMARWTLRSQLTPTTAPDDALRSLNQAMLGLDLNGRFITVALLLVEVADGAMEATLACAGHPPGILVPATGEPSVLAARGTLLGVWPDIRLQTCDLRLARGDSIVLYTDGVSDPGPGPMRLPVQALSDRPDGADAEQLADALQAYARQPEGPQRDDIAILALRFLDERGERQGAAGPRELAASAPGAPRLA
jgi:serine phosphatase RsbU (regulator of sigma subunit)